MGILVFKDTGHDRVKLAHNYSLSLFTLHVQQPQNNSAKTTTTNMITEAIKMFSFALPSLYL